MGAGTGGASAADSPPHLSQAASLPLSPPRRKGWYKRQGRGWVCSQRTPRDQDAPGSEVVGLEHGVAVDLRGGPGAVSGVQFPAAEGGVSSASWSKQPASRSCGVQTQPGNVPFPFWRGAGEGSQLCVILTSLGCEWVGRGAGGATASPPWTGLFTAGPSSCSPRVANHKPYNTSPPGSAGS